MDLGACVSSPSHVEDICRDIELTLRNNIIFRWKYVLFLWTNCECTNTICCEKRRTTNIHGRLHIMQTNRMKMNKKNTKKKHKNLHTQKIEYKSRNDKFSSELRSIRSMRVFVLCVCSATTTSFSGACVCVSIQVQYGLWNARVYRVDRLIAYFSIATRDTCKAAKETMRATLSNRCFWDFGDVRRRRWRRRRRYTRQ